ncbi:MAG TPA: dockerin type I domain-containing protein [Planctomycetota bacterium]|nr:dockerin type I domain-containing protein [Planctomycetota bacterium]
MLGGRRIIAVICVLAGGASPSPHGERVVASPSHPAPPPSAAAACTDESETGCFLSFEALGPAMVLVRADRSLQGDYPYFSIGPVAEKGVDLTLVVEDPRLPLEPAVLSGGDVWRPLPVRFETTDEAARRWFSVRATGARTVVRLWDAGEDGFRTGSLPPAPRGLDAGAGGEVSPCAAACYAPGNSFCHDFERLRCHLESIAGHPHAAVSVLGWTRPCPGETGHVPREIFKVRITDPSVPVGLKTRIVLTARVHGGERLASFIVEGLMDHALGLEVGRGASRVLPRIPPLPADLLQKLDLVIYPNLNPDGSADLDGDGEHNYKRHKCGIDMNRRWGTDLEDDEAYEVHLVHQDILRESRRRPFRFHRDFHGWSRTYQGGLRHGVGSYSDAAGGSRFQVSREYFDLESAVLAEEAARIPYRRSEYYIINSERNPPPPGSARFALYHELGPVGIITDTSESSLDAAAGSEPPYASGEDLRLEGAWLLQVWYDMLPVLGTLPGTFTRGDASRDGNVNLTDAVAVLSYLYGGAPIGCEAAADLDRDERVTLTDALYLLHFNFAGGPPPPPPFPWPEAFEEDGSLECDG